MALMYIKDGNNVFELTATTDVAFSYRGSVTNYPVEDGFANTDHYTIENTTLSMAGVITEVIHLNNDSPKKGQKDYIEGLRALQLSRRPFTVFLDDKLKPFKNCLFTSFDASRSIVEGTSGWKVSLSIEQIRVENKAQASLVQVQSTSTTESSEKTSATKEGAVNDKAGATADKGTVSTREVRRGSLNAIGDDVGRVVGGVVADIVLGG